MVDPERLIEPRALFRQAFPGLGFREVYSFRTSGNPVLVTDPIYLADVYNSKDEIASFVRDSGVIIMDFGGDVSCPVWWQHPYALLPISLHLPEDDVVPPQGATVLADADTAGCDSGSFVFLPITEDLPPALRAEVEGVVARRSGALLELPPGRWRVFYEQWDPPQPGAKGLYRNIVLRWEPAALQGEYE